MSVLVLFIHYSLDIRPTANATESCKFMHILHSEKSPCYFTVQITGSTFEVSL